MVFGRYAASLAVDGAVIPRIDPKTGWEGELAVIIERSLFRASLSETADAILGYAVFNDISARTYQFHSSQWTMGKNGDGSGILGDIITADQAGVSSTGWRLTTRVNGEIMQDTLTSDLIFDVPALISYLSEAMTLKPGDVIATGTPAGVGVARSPQVCCRGAMRSRSQFQPSVPFETVWWLSTRTNFRPDPEDTAKGRDF